MKNIATFHVITNLKSAKTSPHSTAARSVARNNMHTKAPNSRAHSTTTHTNKKADGLRDVSPVGIEAFGTSVL